MLLIAALVSVLWNGRHVESVCCGKGGYLLDGRSLFLRLACEEKLLFCAEEFLYFAFEMVLIYQANVPIRDSAIAVYKERDR